MDVAAAPQTLGSEAEQLRVAGTLANLIKRGAQRPATMKTLPDSVRALFQPKLPESEATAVLAEPQRNSVLVNRRNQIAQQTSRSGAG